MSKNKMRFCIDSCIMKKDERASASSKMLENFISPFTATIIEKAIDSGLEYAGQVETTELAVSRLDTDERIENDCLSKLKNESCEVVFCNDFSGRIRRNIHQSEGLYLQPTYGTVSRFGLIAAMSSGEQIGIAAKKLSFICDSLNAIAGYDENDGSMYQTPKYEYTITTAEPQNKKVLIPSNVMDCADDDEREQLLQVAALLKKQGYQIVDHELLELNVLRQVQYILSAAEISNNTNRFDGIKYGYRAKEFSGVDELYKKSRTEALGRDIKLACIAGAMVLSADYYECYYQKAMQLRRVFKNKLNTIFKDVDLLLLPTALNSLSVYQNSMFTAVTSLAGVPSITIPMDGAAMGIQLIADCLKENLLFQAADSLLTVGKEVR
jgi:aspartyl-tRNA(Asn)/glutamyl-tRNA(Gln) amidotransferase subunit A